MADISVINVGGSDYNVKDATGRTNANKALTLLAYQETGNTASQAYSIIGTPINWKGTLYHTKTAVAKGATWAVGTNLTAATNLGKLTSNIKTYVNSSGQLVFRDLTGADTVLPFSGTSEIVEGSGTLREPIIPSSELSKGNTIIMSGYYWTSSGVWVTPTLSSGNLDTKYHARFIGDNNAVYLPYLLEIKNFSKTTDLSLTFSAINKNYYFYFIA